MNERLQAETEKLVRSWTRHEREWLRDYLVAGVEDPRLNLQSILTRHFVLWTATGDRFAGLMDEEYRFCAVLNWLNEVAGRADASELEALRDALRRGADNAEGLAIPWFARKSFADLPRECAGLEIPNYFETFLEARLSTDKLLPAPVHDTFAGLWQEALRHAPAPSPRPTLLEPACGSANDYRFFVRYGLERLVDYTGFDLCPANVENARALMPTARIEVGNVFEIAAADRAYDLCVVHDLLEHLSPEGLERAVAELSRVTQRKLCVHFFQMAEVEDHVVRTVEEYHWNTLSLDRTRALFAAHGFEGQVLHADSFLRHKAGCDGTHNPNAYTFLLESRREASKALDSAP